jgi:CRISPR/Cas system endoribonuclease Cas6 (RAMP superfamily)
LPSITSFTFKIAIDKHVTFQSFSGFAACGVFYSLVKSVDEDFAEALHSLKKLAPWSASPFFVESPVPRLVYHALPAPSVVSVSFSIMDGKLCDVFREAILKPDLHVDLVNVKAKVVGVAVSTYKFSDLLSNAEPLPDRFAVRFITPTAFRRSVFDCCPKCPHYVEYTFKVKNGERIDKPCKYAVLCRGMVVPLPIPALMFKNMARIWSAFSGVDINAQAVARWAEDAIMVAGFPRPGIRTVRVYEHPTTNKWIAGFIGTVRFSIREDLYKEEYAKAAAALIKMAELTNVGIRRTAGLGMIKYVTPEGRDASAQVHAMHADSKPPNGDREI